MKLLEKPEKYEVLMQNFPDSNDEGISLFQIRTFLEKKGVFCKTVRQSELEMSQLPTSILSFVLRESEEAPHIYLTRASRNGLQIMDRDSSHPFQLSTQFHGNKKYFCLLASTIPFPKENFFRLFLDKWGPYVPGLLFLVVLGSLIFKKRVKHEKV